jgi:hypothetical protein
MVRRQSGARWQIPTGQVDIDAPKNERFGSVYGKFAKNRHLELLVVRSYVWALRAPRTIAGQKVASLSRHGLYEVRLLEPSEMAEDNDLPVWVELFDNQRNLSIDRYAGDDIEETAAAIQHLISQAELLDRESGS